MSGTENEVVGCMCISSICKRLLCTGIPIRTREFKPEANGVKVHHAEELDADKANVRSVSPGIVPRLMGLESMPEPSLVPKYRPIDFFLPRRSADSIYNPASRFDPLLHRGVGTSLSFRDMPTYLQDDVKEFFLARAENIWQKKTRGSTDRKFEISSRVVGGAKTRRKGKQVLLKETVYNENDYMRMLVTGKPVHSVATPIAPQNRKHITPSDRITFPKKHTGRHLLPKTKAERKSEPVSAKPKIDVSAKETSMEKPVKLRQKQRLDFPESKPSPRRCLNVSSVKKKRRGCHRSTKSTRSVFYLKSKRDANEWAKDDLKRLLSKPREMWKQVAMEEIGIEFEAIILDGLVHELVAELWGLHLNNIA